MPRAKKKPPVLDAPQASHGERKELSQLQREAPTPNSGPSPAAGPVGAPPSPPLGGGAAQVLAQAQSQLPPRGLGLAEPSVRPGEPITAGAPIGAGPGPVRQPNKTARYLQHLAALTDDPYLNRMAHKATMKGI
jgi:hypothetical protein